MTPPRLAAVLVAGLTVAAAGAPAPAAAAHLGRWLPPQDAGPAGPPDYGFGVPAVAAAPRDGVAVLLARTDARSRASVVTLRRSRADGRLGRPLVLARGRSVGDLALALRPGGDAVSAWRGYVAGSTARGGNYRVFAARTARRTPAADVRVEVLTGAGESAYDPQFIPGVGGPLLVWARRTGPIGTARWSGAGAPTLGRLPLPLTGVVDARGAGNGRGDAVAVLPTRERVRVARSADAARSFGAPLGVPGSTAPAATPVVGLDSTGGGALAWIQGRVGATEIVASVLPRGAATPAPTVVLDRPATATSAPVLAVREGGGALVAWVQTDAARDRVARRAGALRLRVVGADGRPTGPIAGLGGPGERGAGLVLVARGGRGATALWTTPSRALRAQDLDADGRPGRALTLDRGVDPASVRVAGRGAVAVTWAARGRVRLAVRPGGG